LSYCQRYKHANRHAHTHTHAHTRTHTYTHAHTHTHARTHTYTRTHTHKHIHTNTKHTTLAKACKNTQANVPACCAVVLQTPGEEGPCTHWWAKLCLWRCLLQTVIVTWPHIDNARSGCFGQSFAFGSAPFYKQ
jgi:hypothetical protein